MRHRSPRERRCTYLVVLDAPARSSDELRELAAYLTELAVANFEVLIIDATAGETLEENRRIVRWSGGMSSPVRIPTDSSAMSTPFERPSISPGATKSSSPTRAC